MPLADDVETVTLQRPPADPRPGTTSEVRAGARAMSQCQVSCKRREAPWTTRTTGAFQDLSPACGGPAWFVSHFLQLAKCHTKCSKTIELRALGSYPHVV